MTMNFAYLKECLAYYYPLTWLALFRAIEAKCIQEIRRDSKAPILDLGCGDGFVANLAFGRQLEVGVDLNQTAINKALKNRCYKEVHNADAKCLPFEDSTFCTIYSNCAMEHMDNIESVLTEIARVLRSGGILITLVPSHRILNPIGKLGRLFGQKLWDRYNQLHNHVNLFSEKEWQTKLTEHRMSVRFIRPYGCKAVAEYVMNWDFLSKFDIGLRPPFFRFRHGGNCIRLFSFLQLKEKRLHELYSNEISHSQNGYWLMICAEKA